MGTKPLGDLLLGKRILKHYPSINLQFISICKGDNVPYISADLKS